MSKEIRTTVVKADELEIWSDEEQTFVMNFPSKFYIVNCLGDYIFYHCRNRQDAQTACDQEYGKGFFNMRQAKQGQGSGNYTCTGTSTRRGQKK